jgi:predicted phage-related endonuclease
LNAPVYHRDLIQGSDEWHAQRRGTLTASEMSLILTPKLKAASNDKERMHVFELSAQRISEYVEPSYIGDNMLRGWDDEIEARNLYSQHHAPVTEVGFVTCDRWGFTIGYSPDGLVGDDGLIECKSRKQKFQIQTIATNEVPEEYVLQLQTGLLVTGREWIDFVSYSGGLPLFVKRVFPDAEMQAAIVAAATAFEQRVAERVAEYHATLAAMPKLIPTERKIIQEMYA